MNDTIASIATSLGVGAISIIRVSGNDAIKIVNRLFKGKDLEKVKTHTIHYGYIVDSKEVVDEVLVSVMRSPKTYTREDVVEVNCHGGIASTNKVLELLLLNGCRMAEPGEFTKRAFLNGRIDLAEAESVSSLILSETDLERKVAISGVQGNLSKFIKKLRNDLLKLITNMEVNIDYPEYEDIYEVNLNDIKEKIPNYILQFQKIIDHYESSKFLYQGIKVAIIGRPNVGKSSLLNQLLDEEKAIVTNIPGTTRDLVSGSLVLDGMKFHFIDTAGIREAKDQVEKIGVSKSLETIESADLILLLFNNNEEISPDDWELFAKTKGKPTIYILNKNDLEQRFNIDKLGIKDFISINTLDSSSVLLVKDKIKELFNFDFIKENEHMYITNLRQINIIKSCLKRMQDVLVGVSENQDLDILELDLKDIWNELGLITGESYSEELLDSLFQNFCVGK